MVSGVLKVIQKLFLNALTLNFHVKSYILGGGANMVA